MTHHTRRMILTGLGGTALAGLTAPHIARAATRVMRVGLSNNLLGHFGLGALAFADAVAADPVIGKILRVQLHPNSELGDDPSMLKACIAGTLDGAIMAGSIMSNVVTELGIINAPFLFRDVARARAVMDGPLGDEFKAAARKKDVLVLAWGENGLRHITANQPIRNPADLQGLKLRVPQSEIMLNGLRALGANAMPLAWSLVRNAVIAGDVQAQENAISTVEASKIYEVTKVLSLTGHVYDPLGIISSADLMEDLSAPQQAALITCAQKGAKVTRDVCDAADRDGMARLATLGVTVVNDVDVAAFRAAARPFVLSLGSKYGQERVANLMGGTA